jgi:hypothetical protein
MEQPRDCRHSPSDPPGHLDQCQPLQVLQLLDRCLERAHDTAGPGEFARGVDQRVAQKRSQPGGALSVI